MLVVSLIGLKKCGKTATAEALIAEFVKRGLNVGSIKVMPNSTLTLDVEGKDTWRHRRAGSGFVITLSRQEMGFIAATEGIPGLKEAMRLVPQETDVLICEGLNDTDPRVVKILLARDREMLEETKRIRGISDGYVAISGIISNEEVELDLPVFNALKGDSVAALADLIIEEGSDLPPW